MSKYLETNNVERNIGQNRKAILQKLGVSSGKRFQYTSADEGKVTVSFLVRRDMVAKRREIAGLLSSNEPQQLIFGDEPDKYYLAIADDQISLSEKFRHGNGEVTFIVPDGVAHSINTDTVTGQSGTDIALINAGTAPSAPVLRATMTADNGLVAWTNDAGAVLQFGAANEADGTDYEQSERAVSLRMTNEQDQVQVNAGTITNKEYGNGTGRMNTVSGSLNWEGDQVNAKFATVASDYWNGPTAYVKVPPSGHGAKANFMVKDRLSFNVSGNSYGQMEFNLNAGDTVAMSTVLRDGDGTLGRIFVEEWVMGQRVRIVELNLRVFTGGYFEIKMSRMNGVAQFQIATVAGLSGDDVSKYGASLVDAWTVEGFGDAEIDGMTTAFMKFEGYPATGMNWTDSVFDWVNVDYWKDLPNRFKSGDVVTADVATKKVYVNGVEDTTLQTVGNQWDSFMLPSGKSTIQPVASSWATPFSAEITYREAWY